MPADSLVDDDAFLIAGLLQADGLGPVLLVVDEGNFKRLAVRETYDGVDVYLAAFTMHPTWSHWRPYLVRLEELGQRLMGGAQPLEFPPEEPLLPADRHESWLGFLGEAEVVRRLAASARLDLFRPFPDLETVEVLARDNLRRLFTGLQVKTASWDAAHRQAHVQLSRSSFRPAPSTYIVALAWLPEADRFHEECLFIPSERLLDIALEDGPYWAIAWHPASPEPTRLDPYRRPLASLPDLVLQAMSS